MRELKSKSSVQKSRHMKTIPSMTAILACSVILTGCTARDYSDPDQVAETYVMAVLANDDSHKPLELDGVSPELRRYCNLGLTPDWRTNMPSDVKFAERLEAGWKGKGRAQGIDDYLFGLSGKGAADTIAYLVELRFIDGAGKAHTAAIALRPDNGDQQLTKGEVLDRESVEWKVVSPTGHR